MLLLSASPSRLPAKDFAFCLRPCQWQKHVLRLPEADRHGDRKETCTVYTPCSPCSPYCLWIQLMRHSFPCTLSTTHPKHCQDPKQLLAVALWFVQHLCLWVHPRGHRKSFGVSPICHRFPTFGRLSSSHLWTLITPILRPSCKSMHSRHSHS